MAEVAKNLINIDEDESIPLFNEEGEELTKTMLALMPIRMLTLRHKEMLMNLGKRKMKTRCELLVYILLHYVF